MNKSIDIEHQRFDFTESWIVYKTDNEKDLLQVKEGVIGTKDVDIVGILRNEHLYLIEITDLRGHRIENQKKILSGGMVQEFAQKIRDTIPAIVGAYHTTEHKEQWTIFMQKLCDRKEKIRVVLWMEEDKPTNPGELSTFIKSIKNHLSWLTPRVFVENQHTYRGNLDFTVSNLPGVGTEEMIFSI